VDQQVSADLLVVDLRVLVDLPAEGLQAGAALLVAELPVSVALLAVEQLPWVVQPAEVHLAVEDLQV